MSHTFNVPLELLIGIPFGFVGLLTVFLLARRHGRKSQAKAMLRRLDKEEKERAAKVAEKELWNSFPEAWKIAYNECVLSGDHKCRNEWFNRFATLHGPALPPLSIQVARMFAEMVAQDPEDADFRTAFRKLNSWVGLKGDYPAYDPNRSVQEQYNRDGSRADAAVVECKPELSDEKLTEMFPYPWRDAYTTVCELDTYTAGLEWLKGWLSSQNKRRMAKITPQAVELIVAECIDDEDNSKDNKAAEARFVEKFRPYMNHGDFETSDWHLEEKLPADWYHFYVELMEYPDTSGLWREKTGWMASRDERHKMHPCTKTPLNVEQARILAKALGCGSEYQTELYSHDLRKFVTMESEAICEALRDDGRVDDEKDDLPF